LATQPVVESTNENFWLNVFVTFMLMLIVGSMLHAMLRDRGFGAVGNGVLLFVGLLVGALVMRGFQAIF
jgi:hypothetical protein